MKKPQFSVLIVVTLLFSAFLLGFSLGKNSSNGDVIVSVPAQMMIQPAETEAAAQETQPATEAVVFPVNINTAQEKELMALPGIGEVLAQRILSYRDQHGVFTHETDLMLVEGIGQTRMEAILDYVTIGG